MTHFFSQRNVNYNSNFMNEWYDVLNSRFDPRINKKIINNDVLNSQFDHRINLKNNK